jgi:quinol monooxygenase YgiN
MTERISWVNELAVNDGKLNTFRELTEEMVSGARDQPGTLAYEWYISPDNRTVHVVETYADCGGAGPPRQRGVRLEELGGTVHRLC